MKTQKIVSILVLGLAIGCAQAPRSPKLVTYQTKSAQVLGAYARGVSRGFKTGGTSSSSTARGAIDYGNPDQQSLSSVWDQGNGNYILKQQIRREVDDCRTQIKSIPKNCNYLGFMISSLSRCLDRVITHKNPVYNYAYNNLDRPGQQYYTYLLDWRRPKQVQNFSLQDFQWLDPYAKSGWVSEDLMQ